MTKSCAVPHCKTGYKSNTEKSSVFKVPKNPERFKKWQASIPGVKLKTSQYVCEKHFEKKLILREWIKRDSEGKIIARAPYVYPRLAEIAVPTIISSSTAIVPNNSEPVFYPSNEETVNTDNSSRFLAQEDTILPMEIMDSATSEQQSNPETMLDTNHVIEHENSPPSVSGQTDIILPMENIHNQTTAYNDNSTRIFTAEETIASLENIDSSINDIPPSETSTCRNENFNISSVITSGTDSINSSDIASAHITVPKSWAVGEFSNEKGQCIVFSHFIKKKDNDIEVPVPQKCITVDKNKTLQYSVYGRPVDPKKCQLPYVLENMTQLLSTLERFKNINVCSGLGDVNINYLSADLAFKDYVAYWRDNNCSMIAKRKRCDSCIKMRQRLMKRAARLKETQTFKRIRRPSNPLDQKKLIALRKKKRSEKRAKEREKLRVQLLKESLKQKGDEIAAIKAESLEEKFLKLQVPAVQQEALREIVSAASKRNSKNRRYSEEWIMMCMVLNVRSPGYYDFLRKNNVLPLPCKKTIRSYFSLINIKCGFDKQFGKLLAKHFAKKTALQRHGILLLDEINLRRSEAVCSKNLTYVGLTDFGDDGPQSTDIEDQATHGLVLMFQPLAASYAQPIAVFASKNPVSGEELTKLMIGAIMYLEKNGAKIHGVVADGASTNAKMWSLLGVSGAMEGTKTWFTHPADDDRKVFVFSDVPHVVKNIRNRLYNQTKLRLKSSDNYIQWEYFQSLFDVDSQHPGKARACPKITQRHVQLDNASKMRVRLATQIFSKSVAHGLSFYLSHKVESLVGCEETIQFCIQINDMFDALNRTLPNEGLTPESKDFKVLQDSIQWLNNWESAKVKGDITAAEFLTTQTSEALRISLQSTIDMCPYMIEKFDFSYLLTGKVNQDQLEKFFGTIRQATGCNDHPSAPTFLQLYKILSVYSILKPPKYGNCTVSEQSSPEILVSLQELRDIYRAKSKSKSFEARQKLQEKLNEILRHQDWDADDIIEFNSDHDYALSDTLDCIKYYVTGFQNFNSFTKNPYILH